MQIEMQYNLQCGANFSTSLFEENPFVPKMKTLMPDDEDKEPVAKAGQPAGAPPVPAVLAPGQDLLQELARPCEETVVRTDTTAAYTGFASSRSDTWDSLRQLHPKIQEGTPFVAMPDGQL